MEIKTGVCMCVVLVIVGTVCGCSYSFVVCRQINKPAAFTVDFNGAQGKLDAHVVAPSGTEDQAIIQEVDKGGYTALTTDYYIHRMYLSHSVWRLLAVQVLWMEPTDRAAMIV